MIQLVLCVDYKIHYLISCSKLSKLSQLKNSDNLILRPSHIFLIVEILGSKLEPFIILFRLDCVIPQIIDNLLIDKLFCSHSCKICCFIASISSKYIPLLSFKGHIF